MRKSRIPLSWSVAGALALSIGASRIWGIEAPSSLESDLELVGVIRQGSGGRESGSVAIIRKVGGSTQAILAGHPVPGVLWTLKRVGARSVLLVDPNGTSKQLAVSTQTSADPASNKSELSDKGQDIAETWFNEQLSRLEWTDSFSLSEIEEQLLDE